MNFSATLGQLGAGTVPEFGGDFSITALAAHDFQRYRLNHEIRYQSRRFGLIVVPAGFECDMRSSPRAAWALFPPWSRAAPAAVVHDYLCEGGLPMERTRPLSDAEVDYAYDEAMGVLGIPTEERRPSYLGTRLWSAIVRPVRRFFGRLLGRTQPAESPTR